MFNRESRKEFEKWIYEDKFGKWIFRFVIITMLAVCLLNYFGYL